MEIQGLGGGGGGGERFNQRSQEVRPTRCRVEEEEEVVVDFVSDYKQANVCKLRGE